MKKSLITLMLALAAFSGANAQYLNDTEKVFTQNKVYFGAALTGLDLNYNEQNSFKLDVSLKAGYMLADDWLLLAQGEFQGIKNAPNTLKVGAGMRYYVEQNGIFLGASGKFIHAYGDYNDILPEVNVGYAFFLSRTVTIEPELYYQQSFKKHSDFSGLGFRVGFGIYLDDLM